MELLHKNSYENLLNRITPRGYAVTSLTGLYVGMFPRDSSIQVMAHLAHKDNEAARRILRYILSYHAALDLDRTAHIIDEINDEEYRNTYLIKRDSSLGDFFISQRKDSQDIYCLNAPNNCACQSFIPKNEYIYAVDVSLSNTEATDEVWVEIREDYKNADSCIGKAFYTFEKHPNSWKYIVFENPVKVIPGKTYYLFISATEKSGRVVWKGTTKAIGGQFSYNYDFSCFGDWQKLSHALAFEIISSKENCVAKKFTARSSVLQAVEVTAFSTYGASRINVRIQRKLDDDSVLGTGKIYTRPGIRSYSLEFKDGIKLEEGQEYYLVASVAFELGNVRILTDTTKKADTFAGESSSFSEVGYDFLVDAVFDTDKLPLAELYRGVIAIQEIPTNCERITGAKLLLSKTEDAEGEVRASLCKGDINNLRIIDSKIIKTEQISQNANWVCVKFDLPFFKVKDDGKYFVKLEGGLSQGKVFWCGSRNTVNGESCLLRESQPERIVGTFGFDALCADFGLISNYMQTDANYMLIHAWAMYVNAGGQNIRTDEFIKDSYPIICKFADFFIDDQQYYNEDLNLILNPSLEHSRLGRYWIAYDLITNVFASQAFYELGMIAEEFNDYERSNKYFTYSKSIKRGIEENLVTEFDGKKIYGEFYDVEDGMKFYKGISWVNLAPVAAQWYGTDMEIMNNTYEIYKKYGSFKMYGFDCLASEATLGTDIITKEMIGKCISWEMMLCHMIGDVDRLEEFKKIELETARVNNNEVYPECWRSFDFVTDPGNQEHCAWQVYAAGICFPELRESDKEKNKKLKDFLTEQKTEYYLGIDGGGTKTEFALADRNGNVISSLVIRGCNPNDVGIMETLRILTEGIFYVTNKGEIPFEKISVFAGLAGCSSAENMPKIKEYLEKFGFAKYDNHNDAQNAVAAGLEDADGISVILGTGSIVYAKCGKELHRIGGYGFLFGDAGSGFAIGRDAILSALRYEDGTGEYSELYEKVKELCGGETVLSKIDVFYENGKKEIAKYAPTVFDAYVKGDKIAKEIIYENLLEIANMIYCAGRKICDAKIKVSLMGGLTARSDVIIPLLKSMLKNDFKTYDISACNKRPVIGALYLAGMKKNNTR